MTTLDKEIKIALMGMTYPSEGDYQPLEHMRWPVTVDEIDEAIVREWSGEGDKTPLETRNYQQFMEPRIANGPNPAAYENLDMIMREGLLQLIVYRFGEVQVRFYVIGVDAIGNIVGWTTSAVQT